ncbi:ribonucleoside-diphosphate reductase [Thiohalorhabdus denitrificans]|uniref:Ribonucleoside-diphosphate reductase n=1 Tax=Thiohalorhabdus denitrificans TaxID=381306 RepID=A0A0P9C7E8_9GAMM|nr:LAGLIDADG family homing endonuclease [Thiohalorhabdus denitrificans]KPV41058.1 ribonucleoside-diphosphate reductase [Thiohalorhabdus denitrificans]SCY40142.1 ribonucleoside-diphosphate reductase alpha chain [Thiohalorhabdus denitrificans]
MTAKVQPLNENAAQARVEFQDASLDIWDKKYRLKDLRGEPVDADVDGTYRRVARALADVEEADQREHWYERFLWALRQGAIPAGRIVSNAGGQDYKPATSTINCTVSGTVDDSMDGILRKVHEAGLTLKAGCGIGYDFSTLRPKGAFVAGAGAITSGPLSFMDIFDRMCFTISSAGGRRGAQMATFDVGHPDVQDFIRAKREDGRLRQFNMSLLVTHDFMEAVKSDGWWPLVFPISEKQAEVEDIDFQDPEQVVWRDWPGKEGYITGNDGRVACKVYRTIKARHLWNAIMSSTYDYAEPGFILIDQYNDMNNNWFVENIRATNPCVTADTWVQTGEGPRQVRDLIGTSFHARVDGTDHPTAPEGFFHTADKPVVRLTTQEGYSLRLTSDHQVRKVVRQTRWSTETAWVAAGELEAGDRVLLHDHRGNADWEGPYNHEQGYLTGLLVGDGTLKADQAVLSVWQSAPAADGAQAMGPKAVMAEALRAAEGLPHRADFAGWREIPDRNESRLTMKALKELADELGMAPGDKAITPTMERASADFYRGFLRGLFDADGSVQGTQAKGVSVRLAQSDLPRLEAVQRMLLRLGIKSTVYTDRRAGVGTAELPDGKGGSADYAIQPQHELVIAGENLARFREEIGFADTDKQARLTNLLGSYKRSLNRERFTARVDSVVEEGVEPVYDVQVPGVNEFDANGIHAHNCGEQGLPPYGACLLGSVNLTQFVRNPFTEDAYFDWEQYREVVAVFTRMLDNVVEISGLPLDRQQEEIRRKRRHGMGFLGLGSTLAMLRMKYGEPKSVDFTEQVARELAETGWRASAELAKEKGPAPIMEEVFTVDEEMLRLRPEMAEDGYKPGDQVPGKVLMARYSRYMQQFPKEVTDPIAEHGARFTHHSSIAPTGTISLSLANNASNGIEPSFAHKYFRNVIRDGKKSKEKVEVDSYELLAYKQFVNPEGDPEAEDPENRLPDYFVDTNTISPQQHVEIQAAAQKWIDSSISKTINVPQDFDFQDFKDIYLYAYDKGLKGCTTFRFNPEAFQGVLVQDKDLKNTTYRFELDDGSVVEARGDEEIEYDGELHNAANLYDALKEGYYGRF